MRQLEACFDVTVALASSVYQLQNIVCFGTWALKV